jgi:flagellar hook-basal body complex protein FliE
MELEALLLLLGIEPLNALAIGAAAAVAGAAGAVLVPVVNAANSANASLQEPARDLTKKALVLGLGALETAQATLSNAQAALAEAQESFGDLLADAREEYQQNLKKQNTEVAAVSN